MENESVNIEVKRWLVMAERFKNAAHLCLKNSSPFKHSPQLPGAFLTAFSIELYLKTFLFYKYASETKGIQEIYDMLKNMGHKLEHILKESIKYDTKLKELNIIIGRYEIYSFLKYPDEIYKIIYDKERTIEISDTFINDIEKIENLIKQLIPIKIQEIERHI